MRLTILTLAFILTPNLISAETSFLENLVKSVVVPGLESFQNFTKNHTEVLPDEMIRRENYTAEIHTITTEDGYILTVHRIPGPPKSTPVLLQHGLLQSSADWLYPGKGKSLAYILADHGYDVWLGNFRGNTHSRNHTNLSPEKSEFWDFSWEQIGKYDLPAVITYITELKKQNLFYVGISMGATTFSVMAIERPDVAKKVEAMIALAPATFVYHSKNFAKQAAPLWKEFEFILKTLGMYELLPQNIFLDYFADLIGKSKVVEQLSRGLISLIANPARLDSSLLPKIWASFPAGTSAKLFIHFLQQINVNEFRKFDYGAQTNLKLYQSHVPPTYDLSKVNVPVAVFWSPNDTVVAPEDVKTFYDSLRWKLGSFKVDDTKYNHPDFMWATNAPEIVYDDILNIIKVFKKTV